jgi:alanyl-tRNA synthetase
VQIAWPLFGWHVTASQSAGVAALFFCLSTARGYVLRRIFRRMN